MVVIKKLEKFLTPFIIFFASVQNVIAAAGEKLDEGMTTIKTLFNFYYQGGKGHQVYDGATNAIGSEDAKVVEPMIFVAHQITENTNLTGQFVFDGWSAASDTSLDGTTGASGEGIKTQGRISANLGINSERDWGTISGGFGFSSEYDYRSFNLNMGWQESFADDNFTLAANLQYFKDSIKIFNLNNQKIGDFEDKDIYSISLNASQMLTRWDIIQFGYDYVSLEGTLESTASTVLVAGTRRNEVLPEKRGRNALWARWVHGLNESMSLNLSYRYYTDDWDLDAQTIRTAFLMSLDDDDALFEISYRYHTQEAAKQFKTSFASIQTHMTSDSDLAKFDAHQIGTFYSKNLGDKNFFSLLDAENFTWSIGLTGYHRSNDLDFLALQTGFSFVF